MGIKQNLKLWENQLSYLDENGITVTQKLSRTIPQTPYTLLRLLSARSGVFFSLASNAATRTFLYEIVFKN
jgi:SHS family lactate transporter-like MFS transporter